jgi:hypothetical protein
VCALPSTFITFHKVNNVECVHNNVLKVKWKECNEINLNILRKKWGTKLTWQESACITIWWQHSLQDAPRKCNLAPLQTQNFSIACSNLHNGIISSSSLSLSRHAKQAKEMSFWYVWKGKFEHFNKQQTCACVCWSGWHKCERNVICWCSQNHFTFTFSVIRKERERDLWNVKCKLNSA